MGKQKIQALLNQLKETHEQDIQTSAKIFSVAQVAVNQLSDVIDAAKTQDIKALPPSPLTKDDLIERYQNYAGCRKAAKELGIKFKKTPSWEKLISAFRYYEALETIKDEYLKAFPDNALTGTSMNITL